MNIAIYSGSFNPIHNGHLAIARKVLELGADELWFLVSPQNPLKKAEELWPEHDRLEMVKLAIESESRMRASDFEFQMERPTYTIKTLDKLKDKYPQHRFMLLIGGDNLSTFGKWREHERILNEYGLIVYPRPGFHSAFEKHPNVKIIDAPLLNISSTEIRNKTELGESIAGLVPEKIGTYIQKMRTKK